METKKTIMTVAVSMVLMFVFGCQNDAQTGALIGTLAGAGIGQLAGGDTEATLIGAAVGGAGGYFLGNESDKDKQAVRTNARLNTLRNDINSEIVNVTNSNGSIIQVKLRRSGTGWVGTRGEFYPTLPSEDQLRPVYGF